MCQAEMSTSEFCFKIGYSCNFFARQTITSFERVFRPLKVNEIGFEEDFFWEAVKRIEHLVIGIFSFILTPVGLLISTPILTITFLLQKERIRVVRQEVSNDEIDENKKALKILSINTCFQDPFATPTGGVTQPFEKFNNQYPTRIDAFAEYIAKENPEILLCQEVHDYNAMNALRDKLIHKNLGYSTFIEDIASHPICINSGLFVAAKKGVNIKNIQFAPYDWDHRGGVTLGALQGCLYFDVEQTDKILRVATTHLAYAYNDKVEKIRQNQLGEIAFPQIEGKNALLIGDFNFKTSELLQLTKDHYPQYKDYVDLLEKHNKEEGGKITTTRFPGSIRPKKSKECVDTAMASSQDVANACTFNTKEPFLSNLPVTDHSASIVVVDFDKLQKT